MIITGSWSWLQCFSLSVGNLPTWAFVLPAWEIPLVLLSPHCPASSTLALRANRITLAHLLCPFAEKSSRFAAVHHRWQDSYSFVMVGALMFLGCPLRMILRIAGGNCPNHRSDWFLSVEFSAESYILRRASRSLKPVPLEQQKA